MTTVNISEVKLNPNNPRLIKDERFSKLVKSIQDFPEMLQLRPIVVNDDMVVLGGNMRLRACKEAGMKQVPILKASQLTEDQQREFIIKDNVGFGEWDWDLIANDWDQNQVTEWGLEIPDFPSNGEVKEDDYEIPDEIETDIKAGDMFEIGSHRLLCGDSTKGEDVERLVQSGHPGLMVTDPPYGVEYDAEWRKDSGIGSKNATYATGKVSNDDQASWKGAYSLFTGDVAYVWCASWHLPTVSQDLIGNNFFVRALIIWNKNRLIPSRGHYHWKHEPCWYAVKKGRTANWIGGRKQGTIWDIDVVKNDTGHSTQKPVECMARPIRNHDGDVYDPFGGSGTTMVAGHQLGRKVYMIDIDPKYCQVTIDRMKKLDPAIEIKMNGKPYKQTKNRRNGIPT